MHSSDAWSFSPRRVCLVSGTPTGLRSSRRLHPDAAKQTAGLAEQLESRLHLAVITWTGGSPTMPTDWHQGMNWSTGTVPGANDDARIETAGATITVGANVTVRSVTVTADRAVQISGGTFSPTGGAAAPFVDSTLNRLNLMGGAFTPGATVTITGELDWTGGTIGRAAMSQGRVVTNALFRARGGTKTLTGQVELETRGTSEWTEGSILFNSATWTNLGTLFARSGSDDLNANVMGGPNLLTNQSSGTIVKEQTGNVTINATVNNSSGNGVRAEGGTLQLSGGGTSTGPFVANNATIVFGGGHTLQASVAVSHTGATGGITFGAGTNTHLGTTAIQGLLAFQTAGAVIGRSTLTRDASAGRLLVEGSNVAGVLGGVVTVSGTGPSEVKGGRLEASGLVTVNGVFDWTGGTIDTAAGGLVRLPGGSTLNLSGSATRTLKGVLETAGTTNWTLGDLNFTGGTWLNSGTFTAQLAATLQATGGSGANAFINTGRFTKADSGTVTFGTGTAPIAFRNDAASADAVRVTGGTLILAGGGVSTGDFLVESSTLELRGGHTLAPTVALVHTGSTGGVTFGAGANTHQGTTSIDGTLRFADTTGANTFAPNASTAIVRRVEVVSGAATLNTPMSVLGDPTTQSSGFMQGGTLVAGDIVSIARGFDWTGGTIANTGIGKVVSTGQWRVLSGGTAPHMLSGRLETGGTARWTSANVQFVGGTWVNDGTFTVQINRPDMFSFSGVSGNNVFINNRTFVHSGDGQTSFNGVAFNNANPSAPGGVSVRVDAGTLSLNGGGVSTSGFSVTDASIGFSGGHTLQASSSIAHMGLGGVTFAAGSNTHFGATTIDGALTISGGATTFASVVAARKLVVSSGSVQFLAAVTISGVADPAEPSVLSGGTLTAAADLTIAQFFDWTSGTIDTVGAGVVNTAGTLRLTTSSTKTLRGRLESRPSTPAHFTQWTQGPITLDGGTWINAGLFVARPSDSTALIMSATSSGGASRFLNMGAGALRKETATRVTVASGITFNNEGVDGNAVHVVEGELEFLGGGTSTGAFRATNGTLRFAGGHTLLPSSSITHTGTQEISFQGGENTHLGQAMIDGLLRIETGTTTFGTLVRAGTLHLVSGTIVLSAGATITGSAPSTIASGATLTTYANVDIGGMLTWAGGNILARGGRVASTGSLTINGPVDHVLLGTLQAAITSWTAGNVRLRTGTFVNTTVFQANAGGQNVEFSGSEGVNSFVNLGRFEKSGTGIVSFRESGTRVAFNAMGNVEINGGTLRLDGGGDSTGDFTVTGGGLKFTNGHILRASVDLMHSGTSGGITFGAGTNTHLGTTSVAGELRFEAGTTTIGAGGAVTAGFLTIDSGATATFGAVVSVLGSIAQTRSTLAGTLVANSEVVIGGVVDWTGGSVSTGLTGRLRTTGTLEIKTNAHTLSGVLELDGTTRWDGGALSLNAATIINDGSLEIRFTPTTGSLDASGVSGVNLVTNNGILTKNGAGTARFIAAANGTRIAFNSGGSVLVNGGRLALDGGGVSTGRFLLAENAFLDFRGGHTLQSSVEITQPAVVRTAGGTSPRGGVVFGTGANTLLGTLSIGGDLTLNTGTNVLGSDINALTVGRLNIENGTVTLNGAAFVSDYLSSLIASGVLVAQRGVTFAGVLDWTGGTVVAASGTQFRVSGRLNLSAGARTLSGRLVTDGTSLWNGGSLDLSSATIVNNGAMEVAVATGQLRANGGAGVNTFINNGTFTKTGPGELTFDANPSGSGSGVAFQNTGTIVVSGSGGTLRLTGGSSSGQIRLLGGTAVLNQVVLTGSLSAQGGTLDINGDADLPTEQFLASEPAGLITVSGHLTGATRNVTRFSPQGILRFDGAGTPGLPQRFEVRSQDRGAMGAGYVQNFAFGRIEVAAGTHVRLEDLVRETGAPEALYIGSLVVSAGATLDLGGFSVYARTVSGTGSIVGGSVRAVPAGGDLILGAPVVGEISSATPAHDWTFFGREGRGVTMIANPALTPTPGAPDPVLRRVKVTLLDPTGMPVAGGQGMSNADGQVVDLRGVRLPSDGMYTIRIEAAPNSAALPARYALTAYDAPLDVASLPLGQVMFGSIEAAYAVDKWTFVGRNNQQVQFTRLDSPANSALRFTLRRPDGTVHPNLNDQFATGTAFNLTQAGLYTLEVFGQGLSTGTYSFRLRPTPESTPLMLGATTPATLQGTDDARIFPVTIAAPNPLLVQVSSFQPSDRTEVYVRLGMPPTRGEFDYRFTNPATGNHTLLVDRAGIGTWFVLVYAQSLDAMRTFNIRVSSSPILLTGATPDTSAAEDTAELTLDGAGFQPGAVVEVLREGNVVATVSNPELNSFTSLTAAVPLVGIDPGDYDVRVRRGMLGSDTLSNALRVLPRGEGRLETRLIMPGSLGRHALATIYVEYANVGNAPMAAPLLRLQSADPDGSDRPILTLDQTRLTQGFWSSSLADGFANSVQFLGNGATPGVLNPGERMRVPVYYAGLQQPWNFGDNRIEMEIRIFDASNAELIPWDTLRDGLRPVTIQNDAWGVIFENLRRNVSPTGGLTSTWGDFVKALSDNARFLNRLGQRVVDVGQLYAFEVQQAIGYNPVRTLASAIDASVPTPGLSLAMSRTYALAIDQRFTTSIFGRGWATPWQERLTVEPANQGGFVNIIGASGFRRRFQPDSRGNGRFFALAGDTGVLRRVGSAHEVREQDGTLTRFDSNGRFEYVQDTNGNRVTAGYTGNRLTTLTHSTDGGPANGSLTLRYNAAGLVDQITDSRGRLTAYTYDASNQYLLSATGPDGLVTTYTYDTAVGVPSQHALTSVTADGTTRFFSYDARGRLASTQRTGNTERITFGYNTTGDVTLTELGPLMGQTRFSYDHRGLLGRVRDPFGNVTTARYDDDLNLTRIVDALGQTQSFTWNAAGSLTSVTDQLGFTTRFDYGGEFGRLQSFTDANGNTTRYGYDQAGNLTSTTYANQSVERINGYDPAGNALTFINRRGRAISYTYNTAGQVETQTFVDGSVIDLDYDARGNLSRITEPGNRITTFEYYPSDLLRKVTYPGGRFLEYMYDSFGRRSRMTDHDGFIVNYEYDAVGRLWRLTDSAGALFVRYEYDANGRLSRKINGNNTTTEHTYDAAGQLTLIENKAPDGTINSRFAYTYDPLGRRIAMNTVDGGWMYSYDATGQLTRAVFRPTGSTVPTYDLQYDYDALGNRTQTIDRAVTPNVTTPYSTNNLNQYTQVGGDTLIYDADGNLISRASSTDPSRNATYTYDDQSRLVRVVTPEGAWEYEYDYFGNRVATTDLSGRIDLLIDVTGIPDVVGEFTSGTDPVRRFVHGFGLVSRIEAAGNARYSFDFDALGSTAGLSNAVGAYANQYQYDPFGYLRGVAESIRNEFQFVGEFGLATLRPGLTNARARTLATDLGRFVQADPVRGTDVNSYRYAFNGPAGYVDINGLWSVEVGGFVGYFGGVSGSVQVGTGGVQATVGAGAAYGGSIGVGFNTNSPSGQGGLGVGAAAAAGIVGGTVGYGGGGGLSGGGSLGVGAGAFVGPTYTFPAWCPWCDPPPPPGPMGPLGPGGGNSGDSGASGIPGAVDPNALTGPSGFGTPNFVRGRVANTDPNRRPEAFNPFAYRIDFENYGPGSQGDIPNPNFNNNLPVGPGNLPFQPVSPDRWATAPAQRVVITNPLPLARTPLDLSTFRFTGFGFGDYRVTVTAPVQAWQQIVPVEIDGRTFEVWFEADVDYAARTLRFAFQSIDPAFLLPPDVLTGFLPPEDGTGRGQGYVTYTIAPDEGLTTGTEIRNIAGISFDGQAPIATDQVDPLVPSLGTDPNKQALVTIDSGAPSSMVDPLPPTSTGTINLRWTADDDIGGSGIRSVAIYVAEGDGEFSLWRAFDAGQTSALYSGMQGRTYRFYSVAIDNVGIAEAPPLSADATTTVTVGTQPPRVVSSRVNAGMSQRSSLFQFDIDFDAQTNLQSLITSGAITSAVRLFSIGTGQAINLEANRYRWDAGTGRLSIDLSTDGFDGLRQTRLNNGRFRFRLDTSLIRGANNDPLVDDDGTSDGFLTVARGDLFRLRGDVNGDGFVNAIDWGMAMVQFGRSSPSLEVDVDGDLNVNAQDLVQMLFSFGSSV